MAKRPVFDKAPRLNDFESFHFAKGFDARDMAF